MATPPIRAWPYESQLPSKRTGNQFVENFFGLQVPLEDNIYKRAVQELEKSCGQMCVDGLAEFNRKFAGENLDVACINLRSSNWSLPLASKALWFLRWLW